MRTSSKRAENTYKPESRPHPGETILEKLEELQMGPKEFALRTCKPEKTISAVLNGQSAITPDMAVQFEIVTRIPASFWLNHQRSYDEYRARERHHAVVKEAITWSQQFPLNAMVSMGWLPKKTKASDKADALLRFFGIAAHHAWKEYYCDQTLKASFSMSLTRVKQRHALSAWLRRAEIQAEEIPSRAYSAELFKTQLPHMKSLMSQQPSDFFERLQYLCLEAGVKVVCTPCIKGIEVYDAARWFHGVPLIQLSDHYLRNDIFWKRFFHLTGHILLHGVKDICLGQETHMLGMSQKEHEAREFAEMWTLSENEEREVIATADFRPAYIKKAARRYNTHPAVIVGRLHQKGLLSLSSGKEFFRKIDLGKV